MGRCISISGITEIDMADIEDDDLIDECKRRAKGNDRFKSEAAEMMIKSEFCDFLLSLPIENLDFKMKLDVFMENWEKFRFTEINDFFTK